MSQELWSKVQFHLQNSGWLDKYGVTWPSKITILPDGSGAIHYGWNGVEPLHFNSFADLDSKLN